MNDANRPETTRPERSGNDNRPAPADSISLTDLAAALGEDEDDLLDRLAGILVRREMQDGE